MEPSPSPPGDRAAAFIGRLAAGLAANAVVLFTRLVTAVQARWQGSGPEADQRIYYANHASHGDFVLIWTVLPPTLRKKTRPVAGADYWQTGGLRRFLATHVFGSVLVERQQAKPGSNPISVMAKAIDEGGSLIVFPEGTRNTTDAQLLPFKSGIYVLAKKRPEIEFVPVWLANLNRVLPKGEFVPIPLLCTVTFGAPIKLQEAESKEAFLTRTHDALLDLAPEPVHPPETAT